MEESEIRLKIESRVIPDKIVFPEQLDIYGHLIVLDWSSKKLQQFYIKFLKEFAWLYLSSRRKRYVISLCGACGSGKSVFSVILADLFSQLDFPFDYIHVGIDSYHFPNDYLLSHRAKDYDCVEKVLKEFKGRYDTYNVLSLKEDLEIFHAGKALQFPLYSRKLHNPVKNGPIVLNPYTLLLVEGNWLYYDKGEYLGLLDLFDYKFFLDSTIDGNRSGAVERHQKGGRSREESETFYDNSDARHYPLIMEGKKHANRILPPFYEIIKSS